MAEIPYRAVADSGAVVGGGRGNGKRVRRLPNSQAPAVGDGKLKRLTTESHPGGRRTARLSAPPAAFVELLTPGTGGGTECLIELEGPRGKMRIQWKGNATPDLAGLSRVLWESA